MEPKIFYQINTTIKTFNLTKKSTLKKTQIKASESIHDVTSVETWLVF